MEQFTVPPTAEAPPLPEASETVSSKIPSIGRDTFRATIPDAIIEEEQLHITDEKRQLFLLNIMQDAAYEESFTYKETDFRVTFKAKSIARMHEGIQWINSRLQAQLTDDQYYALLSESDLGCYLKEVVYTKNGEEICKQFNSLSYDDTMQEIYTFSAPKLLVLIQLMLKFIARIEIMRRELLEEGFH